MIENQQENQEQIIQPAENEESIPVAEVIIPEGNTLVEPAKTDEQKKKKIKKRGKPTERGIQTMFRISAANNVRVSVMADNKAHIMIGVNSIILSVLFGLVLKSLPEYSFLLIPTLIMGLVNVSTIIVSILATRPKISEGVFTQEKVEKKSVNLLYFGSFYKMPFETYNAALIKMMDDPDFLYESLRKDLYWQGRVLGRKYHLLRISYNLFMYGLIIATLAFILAYLDYGI